MADEINMDDVGNAEAVLVRLINERKSLESAQQVLMTYRMVKGQLEPAVVELKAVQNEIVLAKEQLAGVEGDVTAMIDRVNNQVKVYRDKEFTRVQGEIDLLVKERDGLLEDCNVVRMVIAEEEERFNRKKGEMEEELRGLRDELVEVRREHGVLAEAVSNAASFFKVA